MPVSDHEPLLPLIEHLGTARFYPLFLDWLQQDFGAEQCMVFHCADGRRVTTLLFRDFAREASAHRLAADYIGQQHYRQDPNFSRLKTLLPGELHLARLDALSHQMGLQYHKVFFQTPGFQDKLAILRGTEQGNVYINLYRRSSRFDPRFDDARQAEQWGRLISSLLCKHLALNQQLQHEGPLAFLSEREQQVCRAVLRGKKNEQIAAELGIAASSVITYRKRAYDKLGISSRAQLFALCE